MLNDFTNVIPLDFNTSTTNYEYSRSATEKFTSTNWDGIILKTKNNLCIFNCIFGIYIKFRTITKKTKPNSSSISKAIDFQNRAYLNA